MACQQRNDLNSNQVATDCHWVEHISGKTCVPNQIERLVTLDASSLENAIALDLEPIASADVGWVDSYFQNKSESMVDLGQSEQPNLERIVPLKPDLILGSDFPHNSYSQTSQIAPTVFFEYEYSGLWKEVFQKYAQVLNREETGQQVMDDYYLRLKNFKQRFEEEFGPDKLSSLKISVVRVYPDSIYLYFRESFIGTILRDAGFARPKSQDISASEAYQRYKNQIQAPVSLEKISEADGDVIFVWTAEEEATAPTAQKKLKELQANSLWQNLKAVQNDRVYVVPKYWIGSGPVAANAIVDDLFKYLL